MVLGDLDGDGDLDAFVAEVCYNWRTLWIARTVWLNQGGAQGGTAGLFSDNGQTLGDHDSLGVALGDVDGDGDLDAFVANDYLQGNRVWLNQGARKVAWQASSLTAARRSEVIPASVSLGDLDGDGDLDAFVANDPNQVWLNQGGAQGGTLGEFADSGQTLNNSSFGVALGDLDGDGDLDAFVTHINNQPNRVWMNTLPVDLAVTKTSNQVAVTQGDTLSYTIVVSGDATNDAQDVTVSDTFSSLLSNVSWTTSTTGGAIAPASGNGDINVLVDLPADSTVTFNVTADVASAGTADLAAQTIVTNFARVDITNEFYETDVSNNTAHDSDVIVLAVSTTLLESFSTADRRSVITAVPRCRWATSTATATWTHLLPTLSSRTGCG